MIAGELAGANAMLLLPPPAVITEGGMGSRRIICRDAARLTPQGPSSGNTRSWGPALGLQTPFALSQVQRHRHAVCV